jgi:hypothetical protein
MRVLAATRSRDAEGQLSQPTLTPADFAAKKRGVSTTGPASSRDHLARH